MQCMHWLGIDLPMLPVLRPQLAGPSVVPWPSSLPPGMRLPLPVPAHQQGACGGPSNVPALELHRLHLYLYVCLHLRMSLANSVARITLEGAGRLSTYPTRHTLIPGLASGAWAALLLLPLLLFLLLPPRHQPDALHCSALSRSHARPTSSVEGQGTRQGTVPQSKWL